MGFEWSALAFSMTHSCFKPIRKELRQQTLLREEGRVTDRVLRCVGDSDRLSGKTSRLATKAVEVRRRQVNAQRWKPFCRATCACRGAIPSLLIGVDQSTTISQWACYGN